MSRNICLSIFLILFFVAVGCEDDNAPTTTGGGPVVVFPHEVGSLWTYDYSEFEITDDDTTIAGSGSVNVVVIRDTIMANGDAATIWVFRHGGSAVADTFLVVMAGDSVKLEWDTQSNLGTPTTIILPIDTGLTWVGGVGQTDTTTVSDGAISTPVGMYPEAHLIRRTWIGMEESEETNIALVPNVGIVWYRFKILRSTPDVSELIQVWQLSSYDLP